MKIALGVLLVVGGACRSEGQATPLRKETELTPPRPYTRYDLPRGRAFVFFEQPDAESKLAFPKQDLHLKVWVEQSVPNGYIRLQSVQPALDPDASADAGVAGVVGLAVTQKPEDDGMQGKVAVDGVEYVRNRYSVIVHIHKDAEPKPYRLRFAFDVKAAGSDGIESSLRFLDIHVGTKSKDILKTRIKPESEPLSVDAGYKQSPSFLVTNPFPDYTLTLTGYKVVEGSRLIRLDDKVRAFPTPVTVEPGNTVLVPLSIESDIGLWQPPSDDSGTFKVELTYSDGYRTATTTSPPIDLSFKLRFTFFQTFLISLVGCAALLVLRAMVAYRDPKGDLRGLLLNVPFVLIVLLILSYASHTYGIDILSFKGTPLASASTPGSAVVLGGCVGATDPKGLADRIVEIFQSIPRAVKGSVKA